jgi:hypothetical protein
MVDLKFKAPSSWSFSHKVGALAAILLVLGPFLPYWKREYLNGDSDSVIYADINTFGLLFIIPLVSTLLIILLLHTKFDIHISNESNNKRINHFILMIWGFIFLIIYFADVVRAVSYSTSYYSQFASYGLWFIVLGFLLCMMAGYLEWKKPQMVGPQILIKREEITRKLSPNGGSPTPSFETITNAPEMDVEKNGKILKQWSEHISDNGRTFEQCLHCNKYAFFTTKVTEDSFIFQCGECNSSFTLKK